MRTLVVLGHDFGGTKIAAAICDVTGAQLGATTIATRTGEAPRAVAANRTLVEPALPLVNPTIVIDPVRTAVGGHGARR